MIKDFIEQFAVKQTGRLNLFLPICFALGIAVYFALPVEPALWLSLLLFMFCVAGVICFKTNIRLIFIVLIFLTGGFLRINLQTVLTASPFLTKKYHFVEVTGTVEKVEITANAQRLTLTNLSMDTIAEQNKPHKIRLRVNTKNVIPKTGDVINLKATLMPPALPFYPDGYPYSRTSFFNKIGATGYATSSVSIIYHDDAKESIIEKIRTKIQNYIVDVLPTEQASVANALMTGNQSLITAKQREDYTAAGIVHILSVSGFHMALIAGFIFFLVRLIFLMFPKFSQVHNTRKICAVIAMVATFMYLLISGMAVPALRSFGMVMLALIGIICDRRAISLHSVFWVGFILLMFRPESLVSAGFALSFCAVIALVSCHEIFYQHLQEYFENKSKWMRYIIFPFLIVLLINIIAHLATAPVAIYHFHKYANYSILGNLLIAPLFSFFIMPLLFCATFLIPFGCAYPLFWLAGLLIFIANSICQWIATFPYANIYIPSLNDCYYALFIVGSLILFVLKGHIRLVGIGFILVSLFSMFFFTKPDILINQGGDLWSINKDDEFVFSDIYKLKSTRYAWLEAMGYNPDMHVKVNNQPEQIVKGVKIRFDGDVSQQADVVFNTKTGTKCTNKICISRKQLWQEGSHAVYIEGQNVKIISAAKRIKKRPWSQGFYSSDVLSTSH